MQKIPGYTGHKPQFHNDKADVDALDKRDNRFYIPGYSGYVPSIKAENHFGESYGKATGASVKGQIKQGFDMTGDHKYISMNQYKHGQQDLRSMRPAECFEPGYDTITFKQDQQMNMGSQQHNPSLVLSYEEACKQAHVKYPLRFEYFGLHGRGLQIRLILNYLKNCPFEDDHCADFKEKKMNGYLKYGQLPVLTLEDGVTQLCQSNAIARYLGHAYRGKGGELLYPGNNQPKLMHAIDTILEMSSEFLTPGVMGKFMFKSGQQYEDGVQNFCNVLPKYIGQLKALHDGMGVQGPYLVSERISIADLVMFSHFWKLIYNPEANKSTTKKINAIVQAHKPFAAWCTKMNQDLASITAGLIKSCD